MGLVASLILFFEEITIYDGKVINPLSPKTSKTSPSGGARGPPAGEEHPRRCHGGASGSRVDQHKPVLKDIGN